MSTTTLAIGAILVAAVSEILPYTPLKANGVAQLVIQVLKVVFLSSKK
jgi:hypothetical protein